jgi:DNA-binding response OmpR family regulator
MLPHLNGYELGKEIRTRFEKLPIIFLTAKTQTEDVVKGFSSGGTDYLRKPFSMEELVVRINNQMQLASNENLNDDAEEILLSRFRFLPKKFELHSPSSVIKLSNREAEVLKIFSQHINRVIDRRTLLLQVWGDDSFFHSRNLDVYIRKLREYFAQDNGIEIITLKGKGYHFTVEKA